jgi:hypothetical protein
MNFPDQTIQSELSRVYIDAEELDVRALTRAEAAKPDPVKRSNIVEALGRAANVVLPDLAINNILSNFPGWDYRVGQIKNIPIQFFKRQLVNPYSGLALTLPGEEDFTGQIYKDCGILALITQNVTGDGMRFLINTDDGVRKGLANKNKLLNQGIYKTLINPEDETTNRAVAEARELFYFPNDNATELFSSRTKAVLSLVSFFSTRVEIADALEVKRSEVVSALSPINLGLGMKAQSFISDIAIVALAYKIAPIGHIPSGVTNPLDSEEKEFLRKSFSLDKNERPKTQTTEAALMWTGIQDKTKLHDRHPVMLHAVKDEVIVLPDIATLEQKLAA